jgi:hypothetical protein
MSRGLPPAVDSVADSAPVLSSHTSTDQWQSFEMRMRRRRAERCVLRAQVALEAGFPEDARIALDEARRLDSSTPDFETLSAAVVIEEPTEIAAREPRSLTPFVSVAILITVGIGVGAFALSGGTDTRDLQPPTERVQSAPPPVDAERTAPVSPAVAVATTSGERASREPPRALVTKEPERRPSDAPIPSLISTPVAATLAVGRAIRKPDVPVSDVSKPTESRNPYAPAITLEEAPLLLPSSSGPSLTLPDPPAPEESPRIRAALTRYEAGYSALDVAAVQSVWPAVDARSLSRAFEGLASQRIALGQCSIAIDAASATAICRGTANWTPKIGGGTRSEARRWVFDLRRADGEWRILRVSTR